MLNIFSNHLITFMKLLLGNAILNAKTPVMDELYHAAEEFVSLDASGLAVGLPEGLMGNSEVGHLTIGAGRAMYQSIVKIDLAVKDKSLYSQQPFVDACQRAKAGNGRLHFLGLVSIRTFCSPLAGHKDIVNNVSTL